MGSVALHPSEQCQACPAQGSRTAPSGGQRAPKSTRAGRKKGPGPLTTICSPRGSTLPSETPLRLHNAPGPLLPFGRSPRSEVSSSGNKSRSPSCAQVAPAAPEAQHAIPLCPLSLRGPAGLLSRGHVLSVARPPSLPSIASR